MDQVQTGDEMQITLYIHWHYNNLVYPKHLKTLWWPTGRCPSQLRIRLVSNEGGSSTEIQMTAAATPLPLCCSKAGFFELRTVAPDWRNLSLVVVLTQKIEVNIKCSFFDKVPIEQWICRYFYGHKDSRNRVQVRKSHLATLLRFSLKKSSLRGLSTCV